MVENNETTLKIIILGSTEVGKTSILNRYFQNEFSQNLLSTVGIDFKTKFFKFDDEKVKINYIDTAGQEKFRAISVNYLKGTNGVILVFDITQRNTFDLIQGWIDDINQNINTNIGKILLGNKKDLEHQREVSLEDAEQLANEIGCKYIEGSAKTGENICKTLDEIARITFFNYKHLQEKRVSIRITGESSNNSDNNKEKNCC